GEEGQAGPEGPEGEPGEGEEEETTTSQVQSVEILLEPGEELTDDEVLREYLNTSLVQPLLLTVSPQDALVLKWAGEAGAAMHVV
ncbi:MAG: hypothetical protein GTN93_23590, partial [Anaerolineae bacterium]|nr:hypothetical protein [Anaerolineae bacterium]NIQ81024.1 hypothetical protein [Anaerolineae bacterium]